VVTLLANLRTNLTSSVNTITNYVQQNFSSNMGLILSLNNLTSNASTSTYTKWRVAMANLTVALNTVDATALANGNAVC
jgi:hypothetical protein